MEIPCHNNNNNGLNADFPERQLDRGMIPQAHLSSYFFFGTDQGWTSFSFRTLGPGIMAWEGGAQETDFRLENKDLRGIL